MGSDLKVSKTATDDDKGAATSSRNGSSPIEPGSMLLMRLRILPPGCRRFMTSIRQRLSHRDGVRVDVAGPLESLLKLAQSEDRRRGM